MITTNHKEEGMNTLSFTGEMARLQQAIAESHDLVVCRGTVLDALNLRTSERVLEVGCGGGYLTYEAARFVGPTGRVCAIDISPDQIAPAQQARRRVRLGRMPHRGYRVAAPRRCGIRCRFCRSSPRIYDRSRRRTAPDPPDAAAGRAACYRGDGLEFGGVAFRGWAADAAGTDRMGAAYAVPKSAVYPGGAATTGGDPSSPADRDPD